MRRVAFALGLLLTACTEPKHEVSVEVEEAGVSREVTAEVSPEQAAAIKAEIKKPNAL